MKKKSAAVQRFLTVLSLVAFVAAAGFAQPASFAAKQKKPQPRPPQGRTDPGRAGAPAPRAAPPGPVHSCAEWEESEGVMALWQNFDLMNKLRQDNQVYIPVDSTAEQNWWISQFNSYGIPLANFHFLSIQTDTIYTRDYGPWFVWDGNHDLGIVGYDPDYGPHDDVFAQSFAALFGIAYYSSGLKHVGGNFYPNAYGVAFSSTMAYWINWQYTHAQLDALFESYWGIERYHTVPVTAWTIQHHDTFGKPANPETIIVGQFPEDSEHYLYGEGMAEHYASLESPWGRPYKVMRMPMFTMNPGVPWSEFRPYINSLVSNKSVYVPITNHPDDQIALRIFGKAFPGYKIVGVDHLGTGWSDSLHCRTRNFVRRDAIRIYPYPPGDTEDTASGYTVTARVIPPKGAALLAGYPVIRWTDTGGAPFNSLVMAATGAPDQYGAAIPARPLGSEVSFYIEAQDDGGRSAVYPLVAPDGLMTFRVRQDVEAPVLSRFVPARGASANAWPPVIRALCTDDMAEPEVWIEYTINGAPQPAVPLAREEGCYFYSGGLAGSVNPGDVVAYQVKASDQAAAPNTDRLPQFGQIYCPVQGSGTVAVVDLPLRRCSGPFIGRVLGDLGIPFTYYTSWPSAWTEHDLWFIDLGVAPDNYILSASEANDIVAALQAGDSIYLEGGDAWCYDPTAATLRPWFGVQYQSDGLNLEDEVIGQAGTVMSGLVLPYRGENTYMDEIGAVAPGQVVFRSSADGQGRAVLHAAGGCRTIASTFALGGLQDQAAPNTRREVLIRCLEALGVTGIELSARSEGRLGGQVPVRLEGSAGDQYVLYSSLFENYEPTPFGLLRLRRAHGAIVAQGTVPPSGVVEVQLSMPSAGYEAGREIHLQALIGTAFTPGSAHFTNRCIVEVVK